MFLLLCWAFCLQLLRTRCPLPSCCPRIASHPLSRCLRLASLQPRHFPFWTSPSLSVQTSPPFLQSQTVRQVVAGKFVDLGYLLPSSIASAAPEPPPPQLLDPMRFSRNCRSQLGLVLLRSCAGHGTLVVVWPQMPPVVLLIGAPAHRAVNCPGPAPSQSQSNSRRHS